ncbi:MAG TPA: CehA/McbA family metallohydrolase [Chthonomonadaceae bacterium]|nr:CehA/McbA family metallohydrolase [Chthonomonadaceae bacterium]
MHDYEPLDLSAFCNAGPEIYRSGRKPATGAQTFHGLPFRIGEGDRCFLAFGAEAPRRSEPLALPIEKAARRVLFAHVLLESYLHEGEPVGREVARYAFIFQDGERVEVPIRERFEIAVVPTGWGEMPFLAVPDQKDGLADRYHGDWGASGIRQTEARQAWPRDYYLWAWQNPRPDVPLARIEITPASPTPNAQHPTPGFVIAALTLGHADEEPFFRHAGLPIKLILPKPEDAAAPFALAVEVDRGIATYPYALPEQSAGAFLADPQRGWGEKLNQANSPAYVEVAAIPSATVTVKRGEEAIGSAKWGELEEKRVVETDRVRFEVVDTGRNWVHTTVLDDDTGKPVPCRVHFRTPDGIPYAPHGHHPHVHSNLGTWHIDVGGDVRMGQISYAYIDGKCQGWLPRGEVIVDVARGYEYEPLRAKVEIKPGQRELTLRLKRNHNLNAERYFSGDTHVHFLSTQGALTEAAAEDLDVVNLLLSQWGHLFTNTEEFTGRPAPSADGETIVYATQENRQHLLGHLTLLGLKEPVMPWCSDGPSEAELGGNLETTLSHWADACHAQGGTVVIPHIPNPNGEPAALIATGRADAVEFLVHNPFFHLEYYRYLNGGYRLPLAGGTDKMDSGVPVGLYRTYAYIPPDEPFTYDNWCKALRSGNTFHSGGPLLRFTVNGQPIGSTITLGRDGGTVEVEAVATSIFPIHTLEIVQGGHVVASTEEANGARELRLRTTLKIEQASWLCARCAGPGYTSIKHHDSWGRGIMAHTSPIYLACGGDYDVFQPETAHYMLTLLDGSVQYIRKRAPQWHPGTVTHHHGEADHLAFLERPFQEAIAAVHKKLHDHGIPH